MMVRTEKQKQKRREYDKRNNEKIKEDMKIWRKENKEATNKTQREWGAKNRDKQRKAWDNIMFGGNAQLVLERDNFQCQDCGMTQEQSIIIFNRRLSIHHKDITGVNTKKEDKNNDVDNLITLCSRCHMKEHSMLNMERRWGDLIKQDESDWRYPKIRKLVREEINNGLSIKNAKIKVFDDTGMGISSIDHMYYMKRELHDALNVDDEVER